MDLQNNDTMKRFATLLLAAATVVACAPTQPDIASMEDAGNRIEHAEPLSWWVGMKTPLQLMVHGKDISACEVAVAGGDGVRITGTHKADNPDFLFVDIAISPRAKAGTYYLVFTRDGESFKYAYELGKRREGSRERKSFTTADMIYLLMPDRFANGDPSNDTVAGCTEGCDRNAFSDVTAATSQA